MRPRSRKPVSVIFSSVPPPDGVGTIRVLKRGRVTSTERVTELLDWIGREHHVPTQVDRPVDLGQCQRSLMSFSAGDLTK